MTTQELFRKTNLNNTNLIQSTGTQIREWLNTQRRRHNHRKTMRELAQYPDYLLHDIGLKRSDFSYWSRKEDRYL